MTIHTLPAGRLDRTPAFQLTGLNTPRTIVESPPSSARRYVGGVESAYGSQIAAPLFFNPTSGNIDVAVSVLTPDGEWVLVTRTIAPFELNLLPELGFILRDDEVLRAAITAAVAEPLCNVFPVWVDLPAYAVGRTRVEITAGLAVVVPAPPPGRIHRPIGFGEQTNLSWVAAGPGGANADFGLSDDSGILQFARATLVAGATDTLLSQPVVRHGQELVAEDSLAGGYAFMAYAINGE